MLKTRVKSAIILAILICGAFIWGSFGAWLFTGIASLLALIELYRVLGMSTKAPGYIGYIACAIYYAFLFPGFYDLWHVDFRYLFNPVLYIIFILVSMIISMVTAYPKYGIKDVMCASFGVFYCIIMFSFVYQTRHYYERGLLYTFIIYVSAWFSDMGAYFFGRKFGKTKLHEKLSPHKTIEGALGGVLTAILSMTIVLRIFNCFYHFSLYEWITIYIITILACILSIFGDLLASSIKRAFNVKDYSNFIPGHGGVLDRFDSLIFTAPAVYYLVKYFLEYRIFDTLVDVFI